MGIPSYYKKLCDSIPGLLSKVRKGSHKPTHLWIDFNCMVYHVLRRPGARPYPGEEGRLEWETWLIQDVCKYVKKIVSLVEPTEQVFVGVDGVVPMAKMRQQRLRRFKSHWIAAEEVRIGKRSGTEERWDTNSITPGTAFMERLGVALKELRSEGLCWKVSTAEEPGEGEHKAMNQLRQCSNKQCHVVYGLDADLIVLSLLQPVQELYLFREAVECGEVKFVGTEEEYRYFSIHALRNYLCSGRDSEWLLDYCMAMSLVGNDFLPHGLTLKLKSGGHDILLSMLKDVRSRVGSLIDKTTMTWRREAVVELFRWCAEREEDWMQRSVSQKVASRFQPARGDTEVDRAIDEWNKTPLRICDELALVKSVTKGGDRRTDVQLLDWWPEVYNERYLHTADVKRICEQYCVGLDWILKYYSGSTVDYEWCFPWYVPPLWKDLLAYVERRSDLPASTGIAGPVKPQEQLALVLPLQSWWLIRDRQLRGLPRKAPQLWPTQFDVFTAGRTQLWECEARVPLAMPARLRNLLSEGTESAL
jgi:5'-3' exonuclease